MVQWNSYKLIAIAYLKYISSRPLLIAQFQMLAAVNVSLTELSNFLVEQIGSLMMKVEQQTKILLEKDLRKD